MERRHLLRTAGIALTASLAGCADQSGSGNGDGNGGGNGEDGSMDETPTDGSMDGGSAAQVTLSNVGASAWEVTEDGSGSVAPTGEENPTLTFEVGQRYAVTNEGWSAHPFALRASDDTPLLSQSTDGEFEGDADVDWVDDETEFSFTFTESLAAEADYYICTVHPSMEGDVESSG